jgi:hypothetical protein
VPTDVKKLKIVVERWALLEAARHQTGGDKEANPLRHALLERSPKGGRGSGYQLEECSPDRLVLVFGTGQRFAGPVPREFADYLKRFKAGESIRDDHTFELVLLEI